MSINKAMLMCGAGAILIASSVEFTPSIGLTMVLVGLVFSLSAFLVKGDK